MNSLTGSFLHRAWYGGQARAKDVRACALLMAWSFDSGCRVLPPDSDISSRDRMLRRRAQGNPHAEGLAAKFGIRTYEGWLGSTI